MIYDKFHLGHLVWGLSIIRFRLKVVWVLRKRDAFGVALFCSIVSLHPFYYIGLESSRFQLSCTLYGLEWKILGLLLKCSHLERGLQAQSVNPFFGWFWLLVIGGCPLVFPVSFRFVLPLTERIVQSCSHCGIPALVALNLLPSFSSWLWMDLTSSVGNVQVQLIRIELRVPEYGWTTQKVFHLLNFIVNGGENCGNRFSVPFFLFFLIHFWFISSWSSGVFYCVVLCCSACCGFLLPWGCASIIPWGTSYRDFDPSAGVPRKYFVVKASL